MIKWLQGDGEHSPASTAEVKSGGATPTLPHTSSCRGSFLIKHKLVEMTVQQVEIADRVDNVSQEPAATFFRVENFCPKDEDSRFLQHSVKHAPDYTAS
jgi:hypothetical protein